MIKFTVGKAFLLFWLFGFIITCLYIPYISDELGLTLLRFFITGCICFAAAIYILGYNKIVIYPRGGN